MRFSSSVVPGAAWSENTVGTPSLFDFLPRERVLDGETCGSL